MPVPETEAAGPPSLQPRRQHRAVAAGSKKTAEFADQIVVDIEDFHEERFYSNRSAGKRLCGRWTSAEPKRRMKEARKNQKNSTYTRK